MFEGLAGAAGAAAVVATAGAAAGAAGAGGAGAAVSRQVIAAALSPHAVHLCGAVCCSMKNTFLSLYLE